MTTISKDNLFFAFNPDNPPVARVQLGEVVTLETHDCFEGQLQTEDDLVTNLNWEHINPATGPVFIEGVEPGDILRVDLLKVEIAEQSSMVTMPGEGALGGLITQTETTILRRDGNDLIFKGRIRVPQTPMIGVLGVAPAEGAVANGTPGPHGGNMDCTLISQGNRVYFTVGVTGALFGAGDMHAAMGDGEIVVCGAETAGRIRFRPELVALAGLPTPFVETPELVAVIYSAENVDLAAQGAIEGMAQFLTGLVKLPINDAGMLMSLVGQLKFCQVVDPLKTVRFEFPKSVLKQCGFKMPA
ncbi:MAG: acetamidase/formamidase family protein [Chloroflexota bacterium]